MMKTLHLIAAASALFFVAEIAHAADCKATNTSVCGFVFGVETVSDTLPITIDSRDIVSYQIAFSMSNKNMAIFMPCNAAGRRDCDQAIVDLAILTGTAPCQDNFYIGLVAGGKAPSEMPMNVLGQDFWLVFAIKQEDGDILPILVTFPPDTEVLDCNSAMNQMLMELDDLL